MIRRVLPRTLWLRLSGYHDRASELCFRISLAIADGRPTGQLRYQLRRVERAGARIRDEALRAGEERRT